MSKQIKKPKLKTNEPDSTRVAKPVTNTTPNARAKRTRINNLADQYWAAQKKKAAAKKAEVYANIDRLLGKKKKK